MQNAYDLVRYRGAAFMQTQPDRLATMALLFGMTPAPIDAARVLEIGCCDGGNILSMALSLPGSQFVGIDITEADIQSAKEAAAAIPVPNVEFHVLDLTQLPGSLGQFDYIVAHGVYSWVPGPVREKLLEVVKATLAPNGVAYISYNAFPGGHVRLMMRDMMRFHTQGLSDPAEMISKAREVAEFVAQTSTSTYHSMLEKEAENARNRPDFGLFHDELAGYCQPVYFQDFAAHAARCGLQYLAEANYFDMWNTRDTLPEAPVFRRIADDVVQLDQFKDFVIGRRFRRTLLCHQEIPLDAAIEPERLKSLFFASWVEFVSSEGETYEFRTPGHRKFTTRHAHLIQLLQCLIEAWPMAVSFDRLPQAESESGQLCAMLQTLYSLGMLEIRVSAPKLAVTPGERPLASPLARWQAANSQPAITLRHAVVLLNDKISSRLVTLLDGTRNRAELYAEMLPLFEDGKSESECMEELENNLYKLADLCLLVA
jgi:SAM-dependent methyltransferase